MDKYFYSYASLVHNFNNLVIFMNVLIVKDAVKMLQKNVPQLRALDI